MKKVSRKGFSTVEAILIIVIIAIVGFVVWYVFHTKNNTNNIYSNAANTQTTPPPSTSSSSKTSSTIIQTKTDPKLGQYLADGSGKPLYTYSQDTDNTSNCTGSCLTNWPAYKATSSTANLPANVGTITRTDGGGVQYTYKKKPLYYFSGDTSSTPTGNNVDGFVLATP